MFRKPGKNERGDILQGPSSGCRVVGRGGEREGEDGEDTLLSSWALNRNPEPLHTPKP